MRSKRAVVVSVATVALIALVGLAPSAKASMVITIPAYSVVDVLLTQVGPSRENACVLRLKAGSNATSVETWKLFRLDGVDNDALIFCMSRLIDDCVATTGETSTVIAVGGGYFVQAQDVVTYTVEDPSQCE